MRLSKGSLHTIINLDRFNMAIELPFSQACERNKDIILETIKPYLRDVNTVLEVGSGTAQHSIHFSLGMPHIQWQTSDQLEYLEGINAVLDNAKQQYPELSNVSYPFELDVNQPVWVESGLRYQAIYTANTFHIMRKADVQEFFLGLSAVTEPGSYLIVYGPFKYGGEFTSDGNREFDKTLRSREVGSAIRDFEYVSELAIKQGFKLLDDHSMPANNQCLVWQRA